MPEGTARSPAVVAAAAVAAATAVAATAATAVAAAAAAATTGTAGFCFVDAQGTAHQLSALESFDGALFGGLISHLDESEATLTAGVTLQRKRAVRHLSKRGEQLNDVLLFRTEGEVADKNAHWP